MYLQKRREQHDTEDNNGIYSFADEIFVKSILVVPRISPPMSEAGLTILRVSKALPIQVISTETQ
jgi:hypothetical protein